MFILLLFFLLFEISALAQTAMPITKYVIPCGGFGTRMLPWVKAVPKEMMPLINKPAIQETVEEGLRGGLSQFYIVTKRQKNGLEDHFDICPELDQMLAKVGKLSLVSDLTELCKKSQFIYIRQPEQGGTGHAVAMLKNIITDDYFAVGWPDIIILSEDDIFKTMIEISQKYQASVVAVTEIPMSEVSSYGVVVTKKEIEPGLYEIINLVEKPEPTRSPSNLVNVGRFILSSRIFDSLAVIPRAKNGELQLPDAILDMIQKGERVIAYKIKGQFYDIGRPMPWLEGTIRYGLQHPDFKEEVKDIIRKIMKDI